MLKKKLFTLIMTAVVALGSILPTTIQAKACSPEYQVVGTRNYLALRSQPSSADWTEIGRIYNGSTVELIDTNTGSNGFWYVYAPSLGNYGYVKKSYLAEICYSYCEPSYSTYRVSGTKHYLALRNAPRTNERNEIGELYNGDTVEVIERTTSNFWYVYAPSLGNYGYVNCNYLY